MKRSACRDKPTLTRDEEAKIIGQITTNWKFDVAKNLAQANLTAAKAADKGNVFILAPNDGTSRSIADVFAADKDVKSYVITGQDAEKPSVQYIIDGKQSMTVLKDVRTLVRDAIAAATTLPERQTPEKTTTYNNGKIDVPAKPIRGDRRRQGQRQAGYDRLRLLPGQRLHRTVELHFSPPSSDCRDRDGFDPSGSCSPRGSFLSVTKRDR